MTVMLLLRCKDGWMLGVEWAACPSHSIHPTSTFEKNVYAQVNLSLIPFSQDIKVHSNLVRAT